MRALGLRGAVRGRAYEVTTVCDPRAVRPPDRVQRRFRADAPNRLWLADLTYVPTAEGFVYTAFITDAFSRRIVSWRVFKSLRSDLALDALEQAVASRSDLEGLVHHSNHGVQYLSIRYTERLLEAGIATSVGSVGDSFDNAMAETINGLYKSELIERRGPWRDLQHVEFATLARVHWFHHQWLLGSIGEVFWHERMGPGLASRAAGSLSFCWPDGGFPDSRRRARAGGERNSTRPRSSKLRAGERGRALLFGFGLRGRGVRGARVAAATAGHHSGCGGEGDLRERRDNQRLFAVRTRIRAP